MKDSRILDLELGFSFVYFFYQKYLLHKPRILKHQAHLIRSFIQPYSSKVTFFSPTTTALILSLSKNIASSLSTISLFPFSLTTLKKFLKASSSSNFNSETASYSKSAWVPSNTMAGYWVLFPLLGISIVDEGASVRWM